MPKINVGGVQLYYEIHGDGDPLVLVPGFRTGPWLWFKQVETFARKFRTIVFDPRGIGESDKPEASMTIKTMADDLAGLLSALAIDRAHLLGASFGGFVAQEFAIAHPQMIRSLVLCLHQLRWPRSSAALNEHFASDGGNRRHRRTDASKFSDGVFTKIH